MKLQLEDFECFQVSKFMLALTSEAARIEMLSVSAGLKASPQAQASLRSAAICALLFH